MKLNLGKLFSLYTAAAAAGAPSTPMTARIKAIGSDKVMVELLLSEDPEENVWSEVKFDTIDVDIKVGDIVEFDNEGTIIAIDIRNRTKPVKKDTTRTSPAVSLFSTDDTALASTFDPRA